MTEIMCPPRTLNDAGDEYFGCGTYFEPALDADDYTACPHCGLTFQPRRIPYGVHWTGKDYDEIERVDVVEEDPKGEMTPLFDGDMEAAIAVAEQTDSQYIIYLAAETEDDRWAVTVCENPAEGQHFANNAPKGSFMFNGRTEMAVNVPTDVEPIGYWCAIPKGHELRQCDCGTWFDCERGKPGNKWYSLCGSCLMATHI